MASAITIIQDKIGGTLERSMVAGVKNYQILIGFIISEVLFMILELSLCLTAATVVFQFQFEGSIAQIFILCILTGICGLSFGMS
jgi:ABC-type transport system involved in cytochrome c biogenesis permease component